MPVLTAEWIDELIEAQQGVPLNSPPDAPPEMVFLQGDVSQPPLPQPMRPPMAAPVPLPMGDPRQFMPMQPTMVGPRQDPLEDIRKQINATQFKTAQEALSAATRFQYLRAFQRDIDAGTPPEKALLRWGPGLFEKNPSAIGSTMRAAQPAWTPRLLPGASNLYQVGPRGQNLWSPPASSLPQPPLSDTVTEHFVPGSTNPVFRSLPTGRGSRRVVEVDRERPIGQSERRLTLEANIRSAENALKDIPGSFDTFPEDATITDKKQREQDRVDRFKVHKDERTAIKSDIDDWRKQLKELERGLRSTAGKASAPSLPRPTTKAEYDSLPHGSRYLDPNGVERLKK